MKRGLKEERKTRILSITDRYNRYPDEKGTERDCSTAPNRPRGNRYNRYPDEKGTERPNKADPFRPDSSRDYSYNRYPDEKGTES